VPATSKTEAALAGNNLIIVLFLVSLVVVGTAGLLDKWLVTGIIRDTKVVSAKQEADRNLSENVKNAPLLVEDYNNMGSLSKILADALPNTSDFPGLLVTVENMAVDSGVKLKSIVPMVSVSTTATDASTTVPAADTAGTSGTTTGSGTTSGTIDTTSAGAATPPKPQAYTFSITFESTYASLTDFLKNVELSARPMKVTNLELSGTGSALTATMNLQTYYQDKAELPYGTRTIE
jgi:hypothetical protein